MRGRACVRHAAPVVLPADAGAEHAVPRAPPPALPDDDLAADMQELVAERLREAGLRALRGVGLRAAGHALRAQRQLLALRRLPRHRRGRARQDVDARPHRARGALEAAAAVHRAGRGGRAGDRAARGRARRRRVRVHAERAATRRGRPGVAVRGAHRPSARRRRAGRWPRARGAGLLVDDPGAHRRDGARSPLPQHDGGTVPAATRMRPRPAADRHGVERDDSAARRSR